MNRDVIQKYIFILDRGGVLTHAEMEEFKNEICKLQIDSERYGWLSKIANKQETGDTK